MLQYRDVSFASRGNVLLILIERLSILSTAIRSISLIPYTLSMQSNPTSSRHSIRRSVTIAQEKLNALPSNNVNHRLLKALLEHAPTTEGVEVVATDIIAASEEEDGLVQLARLYTTGLILPSEPPFDSDGSVIGLLIDKSGW
jgi:hypothetical protein